MDSLPGQPQRGEIWGGWGGGSIWIFVNLGLTFRSAVSAAWRGKNQVGGGTGLACVFDVVWPLVATSSHQHTSRDVCTGSVYSVPVP